MNSRSAANDDLKHEFVRYVQLPVSFGNSVAGWLAVVGLVACLSSLSGCGSQEEVIVEKPPRPITTMKLESYRPEQTATVTGSVVAWKKEQIGFEVEGRVEQVLEPNEMVEPRVSADDGATISKGTPIARLNRDRLAIALKAAESAVAVVESQVNAARLGVEERLPAAVDVAKAEAELASLELGRLKKLSASGAVTQAQLDEAQTQASTADSRVLSAESELNQARAELLSLEAQAMQARQQLADAQRNLDDSVLYSSFRGQLAETHVVPGSYVKVGDPVATVQMMDPVLVEFEVSAKDSRKYQRGDSLVVTLTEADGTQQQVASVVYLVDAVADAETRTFTVKLHCRNQEKRLATPESLKDQILPRTTKIFPLNIGPIVTGDSRLLVEDSAIHCKGEDAHIWKITNRRWGSPSVNGNPILDVVKIPVRIIGGKIPFLGNWNFVPVEFDDTSLIDIEHDLIVGDIEFLEPSEPAIDICDWEGDQILLDRTGWLLRPGDLVQIDLKPRVGEEGFYVPMKALTHELDSTYVFVVDQSDPELAVVHRVEVEIVQQQSLIRDSEALQFIRGKAGGPSLHEGLRIVVGGVHYLVDEDRVVLVEEQGARR